MKLETYDRDTALPRGRMRSVRGLFAGSYADYHYTSSLGDVQLVRFLVVEDDEVVGYAAYQSLKGIAILTNLLVREDWRGRGVGARLDRQRMDHAAAAGMSCYTSCVCEDAKSQRIKLRAGLRPTALRMGYRRGVSAAGAWGSSVVFTNCQVEVAEPAATAVRFDLRRKRARGLGIDTLGELLADIDVADNWYADVLVGEFERDRAFCHAGLVYAGVDLDRHTGRWHHTYQVRNRAHAGGLAARPVVLVFPPGVSSTTRAEGRSA